MVIKIVSKGRKPKRLEGLSLDKFKPNYGIASTPMRSTQNTPKKLKSVSSYSFRRNPLETKFGNKCRFISRPPSEAESSVPSAVVESRLQELLYKIETGIAEIDDRTKRARALEKFKKQVMREKRQEFKQWQDFQIQQGKKRQW